MKLYLNLYEETKHAEQIASYVLTNPIYAKPPAEAIERAKTTPHEYPVVIHTDTGQLVGFFILFHLADGVDYFGISGEAYAVIRSYSIDERYQGKGYAVQSLEDIVGFAKREVNDQITTIALAVNVQNVPAQKVYEKAGFVSREGTVEGPIGPLILMERRA